MSLYIYYDLHIKILLLKCWYTVMKPWGLKMAWCNTYHQEQSFMKFDYKQYEGFFSPNTLDKGKV